MFDDEGRHANCVDAWLEQSARGLSSLALRRLLEIALGALWVRTRTTLGEITLTAIGERVLYTAVEKFPCLASFSLDPTRGIEFRDPEGLPLPAESELREGGRFLLVELLSVLGNLTAQILTPELHAELMGIVLPQAVHLVKDIEGSPERSRRHAGKGGE
jgi:hypothetical protein